MRRLARRVPIPAIALAARALDAAVEGCVGEGDRRRPLAKWELLRWPTRDAPLQFHAAKARSDVAAGDRTRRSVNRGGVVWDVMSG